MISDVIAEHGRPYFTALSLSLVINEQLRCSYTAADCCVLSLQQTSTKLRLSITSKQGPRLDLHRLDLLCCHDIVLR